MEFDANAPEPTTFFGRARMFIGDEAFDLDSHESRCLVESSGTFASVAKHLKMNACALQQNLEVLCSRVEASSGVRVPKPSPETKIGDWIDQLERLLNTSRLSIGGTGSVPGHALDDPGACSRGAPGIRLTSRLLGSANSYTHLAGTHRHVAGRHPTRRTERAPDG